jgi:hypothetical protein
MKRGSAPATGSWGISLAGCVSLAVGSGCGDDDGGISYRKEVEPLFASRCTTCHHSSNQLLLVDIEDPFTQDETPGIVLGLNTWAEEHPGFSAIYNVEPFGATPEASFILNKIANPELQASFPCNPRTEDCLTELAGSFMPYELGPLTPAQIATVRQWITDGATESAYASNVAPIFGDPSAEAGTGACSYCHYPGSPNRPDFSNVFDPVEGIVGVKAQFRRDLDLVAPGDPDNSFLVMKLEALTPSSAIGSPMPRAYQPFSATDVAKIRQWIAEGARNN